MLDLWKTFQSLSIVWTLFEKWIKTTCHILYHIWFYVNCHWKEWFYTLVHCTGFFRIEILCCSYTMGLNKCLRMLCTMVCWNFWGLNGDLKYIKICINAVFMQNEFVTMPSINRIGYYLINVEPSFAQHIGKCTLL